MLERYDQVTIIAWGLFVSILFALFSFLFLFLFLFSFFFLFAKMKNKFPIRTLDTDNINNIQVIS
jgi:hypothetical protein